MANATTKNPWVLDTTGAIDDTGTYRVRTIRWVGGTFASTAKLTDAASNAFWEGVGTSASYSTQTDFGARVMQAKGIRLESLSAGRLYIHFE